MVRSPGTGEAALLPKLRIDVKGKPLTFDIQTVIDDALKSLSRKDKAIVEGEIISRFVADEAMAARGKARTQAMNTEAARPLMDQGMEPAVARRLVESGTINPREYAAAGLFC